MNYGNCKDLPVWAEILLKQKPCPQREDEQREQPAAQPPFAPVAA